MSDFTHFNEQGRARMVDVSEKGDSRREAIAYGRVLVNPETFRLIEQGGLKKGDVLTTAQIGGIMGAKHTPDLIPLCHPIPLAGVDLSFRLDASQGAVEIYATAYCTGSTGVEMEALTAVSIAALTVYDMCKAVQRDIVIDRICLLHKSGGKSGEWAADNPHKSGRKSGS